MASDLTSPYPVSEKKGRTLPIVFGMQPTPLPLFLYVLTFFVLYMHLYKFSASSPNLLIDTTLACWTIPLTDNQGLSVSVEM